MGDGGFFQQAFVYLAAAVLAVPLARRLGLGSVLGYLLAGIAIGPFGLGLIGTEGDDVLHFAEFGVVMMLFLVGLELEPARLWRLRGALLGMGGLQLALTALAGLGVGVIAGLAWRTALAVGLILALSSTAIVLQSLQEKGQLRTDAGQRAFAVLLFQDLAVIPLFALLPLLATGAAATEPAAGSHSAAAAWIAHLPGAMRAVVTVGAVAAIVAGGHFLARPVFRIVARSSVRELFTATALLLVIGIALLMSQVGLSPALGTFVAGVVLAGNEYRHELEGDIEPFKGLLLGLFFLAVGASVDFGLVAANAGTVGALVAALMVVKFLVLLALGRLFGLSLDQNLLFAFSLAQAGEFCFVLLSFTVQNGVLDARTSSMLVASVAISMALTPLALAFHDRVVAPRVAGRARVTAREADAIDEAGEVLIAGFGGFGSTVGRLLRANGVRATVLDVDSDNVELLRRLGLEVFYGDASREDLLRAAGAERARVVIVATQDAEKTLEIVRTVKRHFPAPKVLARAQDRTHAFELLEAGVTHVYRDTLDTSLRLGVDALHLLGVQAHQAHRAAQRFRKLDDAATHELLGVRHDRARYIDRTRQQIRELERLLQADLVERDDRGDAAWDAETLREEYGGRG